MSEAEEAGHMKYRPSTEIYIFVTSLLILGFFGIASNIRYFFKITKSERLNGKLQDLQFLATVLSLFNVLYLLNVIPQSYYLIVGDRLVKEKDDYFCVIYKYFTHFVKFFVYYLVITIARDSYLVSKMTPYSNKSNKFQMYIEALIIWLIHIVIIVALDVTVALYKRIQLCAWSHLSVYREPFLCLLVILILFYTSITYFKSNSLDKTSFKYHIILQCRKTCLLYSVCWLPFFIFTLLTFSIVFGYTPFLAFITVVNMLLNLLEFSSFAVFPYIWNIDR
ncbi:UNVERIFIED_CONTAM: hypothetical protein RMT77_005663 [Armadillidium vulgare]